MSSTSSHLKPIPKTAPALFVRLDVDLRAELKQAADAVNMPMARFARLAIRNQLAAQREAQDKAA